MVEGARRPGKAAPQGLRRLFDGTFPSVEGTEEEKYRAFVQVASQIARRAQLFCALPEEKLLDVASVRAIGGEAKLRGEGMMKK